MSLLPSNSALHKMKRDFLCRKHFFPYEFKTIKGRKFYCKKCITECDLKTSELKLLAESLSMIKEDIVEMISIKSKSLPEDLKEIDNLKDQCYEKLKWVMGYKQEIQKMEDELRNFISAADSLSSKRLNDPTVVKKHYVGSGTIKSEVDIALTQLPEATSQPPEQPTSLRVWRSQGSNLCNRESTIVKEEIKDEVKDEVKNEVKDLPSTTAFNDCKKKSVMADSLLTTVNVADELMEGGEWLMDANNCQAVLEALADRQPSLLVVIFRHNEAEHPPRETVAAVANAAKNCEVRLLLYPSLFKPNQYKKYQEFLEYFLKNSSLWLTAFYGHLDASGIARLPTTLECLGLSMNCASDAIAISSLKPWRNLVWLLVSVSNTSAACDLRRVPNVDYISLHFPCLTDAGIDSVRPSVSTLVPDLVFYNLMFPLCCLSAAGTQYLVQQLRGIRVEDVTMEFCGSWQPHQEEKERIKSDLIRAVGCRVVGWNTNWLYTELGDEEAVKHDCID